MKKQKIILIAVGGIGDALISTPAIKVVKERNPSSKIIVYCMREMMKDVFLNNPFIDSVRILKASRLLRYPVHLFYFLFKRKGIEYTILDFNHLPLSLFTKKASHVAADIFKLSLVDDRLLLYLTDNENNSAIKYLSQFKKPVILHVHSRSSKNHHWEKEKWDLLVNKYSQFVFIQIGHLDEPYVSGTIDLRGKTSLRGAFALLKHAQSFVGVDSIFAHATNAFGVSGVVLFGDSSPINWGHPNNINLYKKTSCSPCYSYLGNIACPYSHECMTSITVDEVGTALVRQVYLRENHFRNDLLQDV